VADLSKATIGFISNGKKAAVPIINEVEKQLKAKYPTLKSVGLYQATDADGKAVTQANWLKTVDTVFLAVGD